MSSISRCESSSNVVDVGGRRMECGRRRSGGSAGSLRLRNDRARRPLTLTSARSRSAIESPPNFSTSASASTSATIASPTTAAAGTAQTSLRSIAAGASAIVVRSTERSGFISVEIGFMYAETRRSSPLVTPPSRPPALLVGPRDAGDMRRPTGPARSRRARASRGGSPTSGPRPMPTALIAGIDISACARRPSSLRSHCT